MAKQSARFNTVNSRVDVSCPRPRGQSNCPHAKNGRHNRADPRNPHWHGPLPHHQSPVIDDPKQMNDCDYSKYGSCNDQIGPMTHSVPHVSRETSTQSRYVRLRCLTFSSNGRLSSASGQTVRFTTSYRAKTCLT